MPNFSAQFLEAEPLYTYPCPSARLSSFSLWRRHFLPFLNGLLTTEASLATSSPQALDSLPAPCAMLLIATSFQLLAMGVSPSKPMKINLLSPCCVPEFGRRVIHSKFWSQLTKCTGSTQIYCHCCCNKSISFSKTKTTDWKTKTTGRKIWIDNLLGKSLLLKIVWTTLQMSSSF